MSSRMKMRIKTEVDPVDYSVFNKSTLYFSLNFSLSAVFLIEVCYAKVIPHSIKQSFIIFPYPTLPLAFAIGCSYYKVSE